MPPEQQLIQLLEQFLEQELEPRIRSQVQSGEIETRADFDDALLPAAALLGTIEEWTTDLKTSLGYGAMPTTATSDTATGFANDAQREAWIAEVCEQLEVTREQLAEMDPDTVFRSIHQS
jgi:hypothetical protein